MTNTVAELLNVSESIKPEVLTLDQKFLICDPILTCTEGETIHNEPFNVTPEKVLYALKTIDAIGRSRKI